MALESTDNSTSADTSTSMGDVLTSHTIVATDTEVVLQMNQRATECRGAIRCPVEE